MKRLLIVSCVVFISFCSYSQKLIENTIDEFTGYKVRQTSWENLYSTLKEGAAFRITRINDNYYFDLKLTLTGGLFAVDGESKLMFKLWNDEIITINSLEYVISDRLDYGYALAQIRYTLPDDQLNILRNNRVVKWRIYTNDGYVETEKIDKNYYKVIEALKLVCDN